MAEVQDSDELWRFRRAWRAEVGKRLAQTQKANKKSLATPGETKPVTKTALEETPAESSPRPAAGPSYTRTHHSGVSVTSSQKLSSAIEVYRLAVQFEQEGNLDNALIQYRQAFRLDSHVDKAYHKEELRLAALNGRVVSHARKKSIDEGEIKGLVESLDKSCIITVPRQDTLANFIETFSAESYEPDDERLPVLINRLPDEVVVHTLQFLDPLSIERFALVCRKARRVSLDSGVWISLVHSTYVPPQLLDASLVHKIAETYDWNFRRIYIEQPRVRLDGVYIAVCHYIRAGLSENAWVHLSHLVTYHRFLRFLPDGQVLSLLTTEEMEPRSVIPLLKPRASIQGFSQGRWALLGAEVVVTDLENTHGKPMKHKFQMTLNLRSRPIGRWNKLDMVSYDSVNRDDGEVIPLLLKHERPFWFSKVRSYVQ